MHHLLITAHAASVTRPPHGVAIKSQQSPNGIAGFLFSADCQPRTRDLSLG